MNICKGCGKPAEAAISATRETVWVCEPCFRMWPRVVIDDFPDVEPTYHDYVINDLVEEIHELKGKLALWRPVVEAAMRLLDAKDDPDFFHIKDILDAARHVREGEKEIKHDNRL